MLNIGKLSPGATEYYVGEVATSAEDYYAGRGEQPGRWVGSLADELGLSGEVDPDHFRRVLGGQHPFDGAFLTTAQGSATRAAVHHDREPDGQQLPALVDTARAAAHLGVSARYVRQLLVQGDDYRTRLAEAVDGEPVAVPSAYLFGVKAVGNGQAGSDAWSVSRDELDRFVSSRPKVLARPGYDLTLRPPKSVSVLWALADDPLRAQIRQAHAEAVDEVVRYYETNAVFARQGGRTQRLVPSAGIVAAAFDHRTSRAGDPLLHTHVVTANMTSVDGTGAWRAIAGKGLYEHAKAAGCLYQAHLRRLLGERLGVQFDPVVNGHAEARGVPRAVIDVFSKRRAEITDLLAESGNRSAKAAQVATLETRRAKDYGVEPETLTERWTAEAAEVGFGVEQVAACFGRDPQLFPEPASVGAFFDALAGAYGMTERSSTFRRSDVLEVCASAFGASATAVELEEIADQFLSSDRVLLVDRPDRTHRTGWNLAQTSAAHVTTVTPAAQSAAHPVAQSPAKSPGRSVVWRSAMQRLYTVPGLVELEAQLLAAADPAHRTAPVLRSEVIDAVIAARGELSAEQQLMVRAVCGSGEFIQPVSGRPGAGKTYALEAVVAAHVDGGVPILGCAVSAAAAAGLERAAGFARSTGAPAGTVAGLLVDLRKQHSRGLAAGTVVVVDEASMLGTRDLARLADHVRHAGGAIRLVGDPDQHGSVDVGGVFRRLCADRGDRLVRLVENNRQQDHTERLAIVEYRDGHIADALARYDDADKIVRSPTAGASLDAMTADWYAARLSGHSDRMIAGPNSTRQALNDRARALLKANGELSGDPLVIAGREFMVGDDVVARHNDRHLHDPEGSGFVKNGSTGTITDIDHDRREVVVAFEPEGTIRIPNTYLAAGRLEHGYARTTYGVQGATHDVVRYQPTDVSSFEEGYVALTRARHHARIYIVEGTQTEPDNDEFIHTAPESQPAGIADVAAALGRRRSGLMAADASPDLDAVAQRLVGASLGQLTARRRQLDQLIRQAPADASAAVERAHLTLESIRTRQRAWNDLLRTGDTEAAAPQDSRSRRGRAGLDSERARAALEALDRAHVNMSARLDKAEARQNQRDEWFDAHADLLDARDLVARAERAREIQVRVAAINNPDPAVRDLLGPQPANQRERLAWRRAVEATALYNARYPRHSVTNGDARERLLGDRPANYQAARSYDQTASAINAVLIRKSASRTLEADHGIEL